MLVLKKALVGHSNFQAFGWDKDGGAATSGSSGTEMGSVDKRGKIGGVTQLPVLARHSDASDHAAVAGTRGTSADAGDQRCVREVVDPDGTKAFVVDVERSEKLTRDDG